MLSYHCGMVVKPNICEPASPVYEVEFKKGWYEYELDVDAKSGRVLKMKKEFDW